MTERLRAVLDTNVFVSAFLSRNPTSPTREIVQRWQAGEFVLLRDQDNEGLAFSMGTSWR